jgi:hypothetical protein
VAAVDAADWLIGSFKSLRIATLIIGALNTIAWLVLVAVTFFSQSDPATKGLDMAAGLAVTGLFALTGLPASLLAWRGMKPRLALALALGFPAAFAILFIGVVIAFA